MTARSQPPQAQPKVRFQRPDLPSAENIERYFCASRETRWFANEGPCLSFLRSRLESYLGGVHCLPTSSATSALMVALRAVCRPGNEVLLPSYTFVATAAAVRWCGLEPVFLDVDADHWHLDPEHLADVLQQRGSAVSAVMACSTFGCPPPVAVSEGWRDACAAANVPLVVDSAAGFGAVDEHGQVLGRQGDVEVFSFHATKPFAVGEGGLAVTTDAAVVERMRRLANFGLDERRTPQDPVGINAKMSEIHAAIALAVLDEFADKIAGRRRRAGEMVQRLTTCGFTFQAMTGDAVWQFVPALAESPSHRRATLSSGAAAGVELRDYHVPLHTTPAFSACARADTLSVTADLSERSVSFPMADYLTADDLNLILNAVPSSRARRSAVVQRG